MTKFTATVTLSIIVALALTGCGDDKEPSPSTSPGASSPSASAPTPGPTITATPVGGGDEVDVALIAPRIRATCDDLISASQRAALLGVASSDIDFVTYPLANGSAAELQAGVLTCQWAGPTIGEEASAAIDIKVLPDAAPVFAAFAPPLSGSEVLGTLGAGSVVNCFDYAPARSCYFRYLVSGYWVEASFTGLIPAGKSDASSVTSSVAELISTALVGAGTLGPAFVPPAGSAAAWSSCSVLDASGAFRAAVSSPSLVAPEGEFTGAGTLFSEAWQRVSFRSCVWRHTDPYSSPAGQIRQTSVSILPGGGWAWPSLRESYEDRGATEIDIVGADEAMIYCFDNDNCTIDALVDGSYFGVNMSLDQGRGGAQALAVAAAQFAIARL